MVFCAFCIPCHGVLLETLSSKLIKSLLALVIFWEYDRTTLQENTYSVMPGLHPGDFIFSLPHKPGVTPPKQMQSQGCETKDSKEKFQPAFCIICSFKAVFAM